MKFIIVLLFLIGIFEVKCDGSLNGEDIYRYFNELPTDFKGDCNSYQPPERIKKATRMMAQQFGIPPEAIDRLPEGCRTEITTDKRSMKVTRTICEGFYGLCLKGVMGSEEILSNGFLHYSGWVLITGDSMKRYFNYTLNVKKSNAEPTLQMKRFDWDIVDENDESMNGEYIQKYYNELRDSYQTHCSFLQPPKRIERVNKIMAGQFGIPDSARQFPQTCVGAMSKKIMKNQIFVKLMFCGSTTWNIEGSDEIECSNILMESEEVLFNGMLHHVERVHDLDKIYIFNYTLNINDRKAEPAVDTQPWDYEITKPIMKPQLTSGANRINIQFSLLFSNILMITIYVYKNTIY